MDLNIDEDELILICSSPSYDDEKILFSGKDFVFFDGHSIWREPAVGKEFCFVLINQKVIPKKDFDFSNKLESILLESKKNSILFYYHDPHDSDEYIDDRNFYEISKKHNIKIQIVVNEQFSHGDPSFEEYVLPRFQTIINFIAEIEK